MISWICVWLNLAIYYCCNVCSTVFGFCIFIHIGVPLIDGGTVRLQKLIGVSRALDLVLTGQPVSAEEALQMGLANRVVGQLYQGMQWQVDWSWHCCVTSGWLRRMPYLECSAGDMVCVCVCQK